MTSPTKPNIEWTVACGRVIADQQTGEWTLVDVIERIGTLQFPALHRRFSLAARLSLDTAPAEELGLRYRVVRISDVEGERTILESAGRWAPGTTMGRFVANFGVLRLARPERLRFRVDVAVDDGPWQRGPTTRVDVFRLELTAEQQARLSDEMAKLAEFQGSTEAGASADGDPPSDA